MNPRATGLGSPRNGMPGWKPYRWHGQPFSVPAPAGRTRTTWTPGARQERLERLARMRVNDQPVSHEHLPYGILTHEQAAAILGVTKRTIVRDLRALRAMQEAS